MPGTQNPANALAMGASICKRFEGCVLHAYHGAADKPGVYSIGWGTTSIGGQPVQPGTTISQTEADNLLNTTLANVQQRIEGALAVELQDFQEAALISFGYNLGSQALLTSTLFRFVNQGDFQDAAGQFGLWVHSNGQVQPGLVARRKFEAEVFKGLATP